MAANQIPSTEPEDATQQPEVPPWGQNLLGIEFLADDWEEDIPLEFFLGDEESNKFFLPDEIAAGQKRIADSSVPDMERIMASTQVNLYETKTHLSRLVDRAAMGEEIVIAKAGKPCARLVALAADSKQPRKPGGNLLGITYIGEDFDAPLPEDVLQDFGL